MVRFLLGFAIGAGIGAAVVVFTAPRSGSNLRRTIGETAQGALDAAREASEARQQELWADFRLRLSAEKPSESDT